MVLLILGTTLIVNWDLCCGAGFGAAPYGSLRLRTGYYIIETL